MSYDPRKRAAKINIKRGNEAVLIVTFALQCSFIGWRQFNAEFRLQLFGVWIRNILYCNSTFITLY